MREYESGELLEAFAAHIDHCLSPAEEMELAAYLDAHSEAAAELAELANLSAALQNLPPVAVPADFQMKLHQKLQQEPAPAAPLAPKRKTAWWKIVACAAAVCLVLGVGATGFMALFGAQLNNSATTADSAPQETVQFDAANYFYSGDADMAETEEYGLMPEDGDAIAENGSVSTRDIPAAERKIIRNAYLSVSVSDYASAYDALEALADEYDGYVLSASTYDYSDGLPTQGDITLKVDSNALTAVLAEIEEIGEITSRDISGDDVTQEYYDVQARLDQYKAQRDRLLELYEQAETVSEILEVESELGRINVEIDSLEGSFRYLSEMTDLATVNVSLYVPKEYRPAIDTNPWSDFGQKMLQALTNGLNFIINAAANVLFFLLAAIPVLLLLLLLFLIIRAIVRHAGKKNPKKNKIN